MMLTNKDPFFAFGGLMVWTADRHDSQRVCNLLFHADRNKPIIIPLVAENLISPSNDFIMRHDRES
jgi:hypothetical protein